MFTREYLPFWLIYDDIRYFNLFLVGGIPTPLKNMTSSVGIIIPNIWKIKNVPNHQAVYIIIYPSIAGFSFISLAPIHLSFPNQTLAKPDP